jgi:serine/threonine protein phosphatase PrpC
VTLTIGFKTHVGIVRKSNQDSYAVLRRGDLSNRLDALLVLADGMGGTGGGDIASRIVAQAVPENIIEFLYDRSNGNDAPDVEQMLRETFTRANHKVWTTRKFERPELKQMGTTCVVAVVNDAVLTVGNLGDSRAYLLRAGKMRQLTDDHSEVWQEVTAGRMTREEAQNSRFRNRITRAIGLGPEVNTDVFRDTLQEGDTVLLCSDGLTGELRDAEIARIMACTADIQEVCDRLVEGALEHGGHDNVTVVALRYGAFVPLTVPVTTDEDDTDPEQAWRRQGRSPLLEEEEEEEVSEPPARRPESRPTRTEPVPMSRRSRQEVNSTPGMLIGLLILMTVIAVAEGYLLYQNGFGSVRKPVPDKPTLPQKPLYDLHNYGIPKLLTTKEVQDSCLLLDDQGNPIVASRNGNLIRVRPNGAIDPLGGTFPSLPPAGTTEARRTGFAPPARTDFALDANGNLFAIDAETKSIRIYSKSGTRVGSDIGRERLVGPVRIAVNADEVLFVIDNHKLYRIDTTAVAGH